MHKKWDWPKNYPLLKKIHNFYQIYSIVSHYYLHTSEIVYQKNFSKSFCENHGFYGKFLSLSFFSLVPNKRPVWKVIEISLFKDWSQWDEERLDKSHELELCRLNGYASRTPKLFFLEIQKKSALQLQTRQHNPISPIQTKWAVLRSWQILHPVF